MLIDEIAKEMSIEQFINHLEKDMGSIVSFVYEGQSYSCPSQIGLIDVGYIENDCGIECNTCWLRAIKEELGVLIAFWDKESTGTKNMIELAKK